MKNDPIVLAQIVRGPHQKPTTSGKAIASLVLGIGSLVCAFFTGIIAVALGIFALSNISRSNGRLQGNGLAIAGIVTGVMGCLWTLILIGMLLPAVSQVREAARRTAAMNQMRQMALALQNYEAAHQHFPAVGTEEQPLSWRVQLLPFLEEMELRSQFHYDEPWDSPHNLTLVEKMPKIFDKPPVTLAPGKTVYVLPTTSAEAAAAGQLPAAFVQGERGATRRKFSDGTSNTIFILEADPTGAVTWTDSDSEWMHDPNDPMRSLQSRPNVILAAFADGSVSAIDRNISPQVFNALITRSGGERVEY